LTTDNKRHDPFMILPETNTCNQIPKVITHSCWNIFAILFLTVCLAIGAEEVATSPKPSADDIPALIKKAESGDAAAQSKLGFFYHIGNGVPKDDVLAVSWYRKAAEQGDVHAQYFLGLCYTKGLGVPKDDVQAVNWFRKAAEQGYDKAQYFLGLCYAKGLGVPKDDVLSYMWLNLAAVKSSDAAKARDDLSKKMTLEQIAEAQRLSREWKPTEVKK
jgi:TPR repeat protein